jgi:phage host-nuclease inhibitor protein Gam
MARKKPEVKVKKITSLKEADSVLKRLSELNNTLKKLEAETDDMINEIKKTAKENAEPIIKEMEELEHSLAIYSEYNKEELFKDKKTIELTFGQFGFRQSTSISVKKNTLDLLKEHGFREAIKVKESVNKDILRDWSDERLALVNAKRVVKDSFWVEVKENPVEFKE